MGLIRPFCAPRATAPCPSGACALGEAGAVGVPPPRPECWDIPPSKRSIHRPFPAPVSYSQNEPAAPDERRAGMIRQKTGKVFQPVFPRFFKSGRGAEPSAASGGRSEAEAQ